MAFGPAIRTSFFAFTTEFLASDPHLSGTPTNRDLANRADPSRSDSDDYCRFASSDFAEMRSFFLGRRVDQLSQKRPGGTATDHLQLTLQRDREFSNPTPDLVRVHGGKSQL